MDHRRAEENTGAVRQEELMLAREAAGIGTWSPDAINQIVAWDDRCKELHGFSRGDLLLAARV